MDTTARQRRIFDARRGGDVSTLIRVLGEDPENRAWAARYLGDVGDPEAIGPLIRLLSVHDFQARASAAQALGKLRATEAVPELLACLERGPEDVMRAWCVDALGRIGSPEAVPTLIGLLDHPDIGMRRISALALGEIRDPRASAALDKVSEGARWRERRIYKRALRQIADKSR